MGIYIILIFILCFVRLFLNAVDIEYGKQEKIFLYISFILMFLLYALRSEFVGRDVYGYMESYFETEHYKNLYFEEGYKWLMTVCSERNFTWQAFLAIVSAITLVPIFIFIKKYSKNAFMSVMVYICYMYFEFNLTALRQAMASSICLLGFIVLLEAKHFPITKYVLIVSVAILFHKSAFAAYFLIPLLFLDNILFIVISDALLIFVTMAFRTEILTFIKTLFMKDSLDPNSELYFGGNLLFLMGLSVLFVVVERVKERESKKPLHLRRDLLLDGGLFNMQKKALNRDYEKMFTKSFLISILFMVVFGMANSARSYMILNQVIIISLPNLLSYIGEKYKKAATIGLFVFLVVFFFYNTLFPNNFDIIPYKFFWQEPDYIQYYNEYQF